MSRDKRRAQPSKPKRLKPAGHSAAIEALIQPAIVVGSTLMSAIAAYVLALDEITRVLNRRGTPVDVFVIALCGGMGFLIDMAIIVSATRFKMHAVRGDPREARWRQLAKWVLILGLTTESMTLFYFFTTIDPAAFPPVLLWLANIIHATLAVSRGFLPPVVIAYFAAGVLPVMFDRGDRNREIKSRTSSNIMLLIDRLSEVFDTDDKAEMLRALGGQLMLDTYATYDETARTSEDQQLRRDAKLLAHLARIHRLNWSAIAADVGMIALELPAPATAAVAASAPAAAFTGEPDPEPDPERPRRRIGVGAQPDLAQDASGPMPAVFPAHAASGDAVAAAEDASVAAQDDPTPTTEQATKALAGSLTGAPVNGAGEGAGAQSAPAQRARPRSASRRGGGGKRALASYERKAREALRAHRLDQTIALLEQEPDISVKRLAKALKSGESTAKGLRARALQVIAQRQPQRAAQ